jgi:hypothetical protein
MDFLLFGKIPPRIRFSNEFLDLMPDPFDCQHRFAKQEGDQFRPELPISLRRNY